MTQLKKAFVIIVACTWLFLFSLADNEFSCPQSPDNDPVKIPSNTKKVRLKISGLNQLCILALTTDNTGKTTIKRVVSAGRSYNAGGWEPVGGKYADLKFACTNTYCELDTPQILGPSKTFQLWSLPVTKISQKAEVSRFLQQSTFGPTRTMLAEWKYNLGLQKSFAAWIKDQIENKEATSHRAYFRSRATGRFPLEPDSKGTRAIGRPQNPCDQYSRWRKYAFTLGDRFQQLQVQGNGPYTLLVNGHIRTEVSNFVIDGSPKGPGTYTVCYAAHYVGGQLQIFDGGACKKVDGGNPAIEFSKNKPPLKLYFRQEQLKNVRKDGGEVHLMNAFYRNELCDNVHLSGAKTSIFAHTDRGDFYLFDPRVILEENTLDKPIPDGGGRMADFAGSLCANVHTFLNHHKCKWSTNSSACGPSVREDLEIPLNDNNLRILRNLTSRVVLAIGGDLPAVDSPCQEGRGRWKRLPDGTECTNLIGHEETRKNLAIQVKYGDKNPLVRSIWVPTNQNKDFVCQSGKHEAGARVEVQEDDGTECWEHAHADYYNVYDFTSWTTLNPNSHPGNKVANEGGRPNPIRKYAWGSQSILKFPGDKQGHPEYQWESNKDKFGEAIGKLGDTANFPDLPSELRISTVAEEFGSSSQSATGEGVLVCGSPGEVRNTYVEQPEFDVAIQDYNGDRQYQRQTIFTLIAMDAEDQLRQRMAHALSQLLVISPGAFSVHKETECWVNYYDIMVRNAFANYRDLLKEVSYSPMMGEMLSFLNSGSKQYILDTSFQRGVYPDENYAREIMQLFTTGMVLINDDGTPRLDDSGTETNTYTNEDIKDGARVWTGFEQQEPRGNIEAEDGWENKVDPMRILPEKRDVFPKMLFGKYVGDGYPLCTDMPERAFLKKGATYRLLGSYPAPQMQREDPHWSNDISESVLRLVLSETSPLFTILCNKDESGKCNFRNEAILPDNLDCDGDECDVETVRVVKVGKNAFYEYIRLPCVQMSFYNNGRKTKMRANGGIQCADARMPAASEACCAEGTPGAYRNCKYTGERMTYTKAKSRCSEMKRTTCDFTWFPNNDCPCCKHGVNFWTDRTCNIRVKVNANGKVAVVHDMLDVDGARSKQESIRANVKQDTDNWFRVHWKEDNVENLMSSCLQVGCQKVEDGSCMCSTRVNEGRVFKEAPTSVNDILSTCHIGSFDVSSFGGNAYRKHETLFSGFDKVIVWTATNGSPYDKKTVFEVIVHGKTKFLKNTLLMVKLRTTSSSFEFRNAPHFLTLLDDVDLRDAIYETEAVLDIYFYHPNTAPFVSHRIVQRFGFSNPSPNFMKAVTTAFRTGKYVWKNGNDVENFGSGEYGDLSAVVAAILLDREPRASILDNDITYGAIREPLLKVIHFLRAMEFEPDLTQFRLEEMRTKIGQMAHDIPTVFSNFLPDNSPAGQFADSSLYAPEATVLTTPNTVGLLSGLFSLVKYGLLSCDGGFGPNEYWKCKNLREGDYSGATGQLKYRPAKVDDAELVVDELNLLLTADRISEESLRVIEKAYESRISLVDNDKAGGALRVAQQLVAAAPEFHTNTFYRSNRTRRVPPSQAPPSGQPYKAVVYVFLAGGCDSYNMLVPLCEPLRQEYENGRGSLAMKEWQLLPIMARNTQTCNKFGVHKNLSFLQESYNKNEALFFANAGLLFEDVTLRDWEVKTRTQLFAHDVQQREVQHADAFQDRAGTGVLGRMNDALTKQGFNTASISLADNPTSLVSKDSETPSVDFVNPLTGVHQFDKNPSSNDVTEGILDLNKATKPTSAAFGELWGSKLVEALRQNKAFADALDGVDEPGRFPDSDIGRQLKHVAKLMSTKAKRNKDREAYYVEQGGYDTHNDVSGKLPSLFAELNDALRSFKEEMDKQGLWKQVTVVIVSEFGRTLTLNSSEGTDHGWGGNYALMGGDLKANILGKYPNKFKDLDVERGRLIPTTSVDSCLNGVMQWMGVNEDNLDKVLPNRNNFKKAPYTKNDLYRNTGVAKEKA